MEHLILAATITLLAVLLKRRVHIHITYESTRQAPRSTSPQPGIRRPAFLPVVASQQNSTEGPVLAPQAPRVNVLEDLTSALVNLGCTKVKAKQAAVKACQSGSQDFTELVKRAIKEAA